MIRPLVANDISKTMEIWLSTNIKSHPFIKEDVFIGMYESTMRSLLLDYKAFVYVLDGLVVGFVAVDETMKIVALQVDEQYQGNGFGERLLDYALEKYHMLHAEIYRDNEMAMDFFEENGFQLVAITNMEETGPVKVLLTYEEDESTRN